MKKLLFISLFSIISTAAICADAPKPAAKEATPVAPATIPEKTVTLDDGKEYTAAQILAFWKKAQERIDDLTNQRNQLAGQVLDLTTQIQKAQAKK